MLAYNCIERTLVVNHVNNAIATATAVVATILTLILEVFEVKSSNAAVFDIAVLDIALDVLKRQSIGVPVDLRAATAAAIIEMLAGQRVARIVVVEARRCVATGFASKRRAILARHVRAARDNKRHHIAFIVLVDAIAFAKLVKLNARNCLSLGLALVRVLFKHKKLHLFGRERSAGMTFLSAHKIVRRPSEFFGTNANFHDFLADFHKILVNERTKARRRKVENVKSAN